MKSTTCWWHLDASWDGALTVGLQLAESKLTNSGETLSLHFSIRNIYDQTPVLGESTGWPVLPCVQCPDAPEAPMPVSERTCCARKPARSAFACSLLSRIENSQMPMKPIAIENKAGDV